MGTVFALSATPSKAGNPPFGCLPATDTGMEINRTIYQEFPARGPTETAWVIIWTEFGHRGLWIESAWFMPKAGASFIQVLGESGPSNIFVPYHIDPNSRYLDLNQYGDLREAIPPYTGSCGTIPAALLPSTSWGLGATTPPRPILIKEIRDRGVAWTSDGHTRRGEELLVWGVQDSGNYEYIIQYGFHDDGTITFRLGSTGYNSTSKPYEGHMHDALWHIDINLGHADHNSAMLMKHVEPVGSVQATDSMAPFNNGVEGFVDWNAEEFTCLNVQDDLGMNARGHNLSYDVMPMRPGTARHYEAFTKHDFWVTQYHPNEIDYDGGLLSYLNSESVTNTDVVLWLMTSNHHQPRDEDHEFKPSGSLISGGGIAQVMWSGFDLHPRNFMDDAPLHACEVPPGLVGWWTFEELPGAVTINDIKNIGPPNNGVPHSGPAAGSLGPNGPTPLKGPINDVQAGALKFDGVDDYVEISDSASLNFGTGSFSVDFWIKAAPNSNGTILDKREEIGGEFLGYHLYLWYGNPLVQLANGTSYFNYVAQAGVSDGFWHHAAVTVNRTGNPKDIRWYVDGKLVTTIPSPLSGSVTSSAPLRFGARSQTSASGFFDGALSEIELFNRVLTPDEVNYIYASGKCRQ
jgi:Concanavalin A-like lectin/glucanases superfamily/Copper amine oxidase, enzyme domain